MANYESIKFDTEAFPFAEVIRQILCVETLAALPPSATVATQATDQHSVYHDEFYASVDQILPLYHSFVRTVVLQSAPASFVQRVPTFRVHLQGSVAVGHEHKDIDFGHSPHEQNFWLPLTDAYSSNSLWIEGEPVEARFGQLISFDGANRTHGNRVNVTPHSRVSMDFRIIPRKHYIDTGGRTVSSGMRFALGDYWTALD